MWCLGCCFSNLVLELKGREKNRKKLATEQKNMALFHIHYNTLDKKWTMATISFHALPWKKTVLCNLAKKTTCSTAHIQPRTGVKRAPEENSCFIWRSCLLGVFITFIKNISLAYHLHNFTLLVFIRIPINSFCYWMGKILERFRDLGG